MTTEQEIQLLKIDRSDHTKRITWLEEKVIQLEKRIKHLETYDFNGMYKYPKVK